MDLQSLTAEDVQALMDQGILPEQIAQIATEQGQPIPPIIQAMMQQGPQQGPQQMQMQQDLQTAEAAGKAAPALKAISE